MLEPEPEPNPTPEKHICAVENEKKVFGVKSPKSRNEETELMHYHFSKLILDSIVNSLTFSPILIQSKD
jgi:hypothetical protein